MEAEKQAESNLNWFSVSGFQGLGFKGFKVWGSGSRVSKFFIYKGFRVWSLGFLNEVEFNYLGLRYT